MSNATRTETIFGKITVAKVFVSEYKNQMLAQLKQEVISRGYYPAMKIHNSLSDNIFESEDFGAATEEQHFDSPSVRTALMPAPMGSTVESIQTLLNKVVASLPNAKIYRILSNHPILAAEHISAINAGLRTKDEIANSQVIRYGEGHEKEGELILFNDKVQYKYTAFTKTQQDIDRRTEDPNDMYLTEEISNELQLGTSVPVELVEAHMQEV